MCAFRQRTTEDMRVQRESFGFLIENTKLVWIKEDAFPWGMDPGHAADAAILYDFVYGCTEESVATFLWIQLCSSNWVDEKLHFNPETMALNGDTSYLLRYGKFNDAKRVDRLAEAYVTSATRGSGCSTIDTRTLRQLVAEAVNVGMDLHGDPDGISPLLNFLHSRKFMVSVTAREIEARLYAWLTLLESVGVDLHLHGQEEWCRFQALRRFCERGWDLGHGFYPHRCEEVPERPADSDDRKFNNKATLSAFSYGADVSDRKLWTLHRGDHYAGQFWRLIEQNGIFNRHVPGGWGEAD